MTPHQHVIIWCASITETLCSLKTNDSIIKCSVVSLQISNYVVNATNSCCYLLCTRIQLLLYIHGRYYAKTAIIFILITLKAIWKSIYLILCLQIHSDCPAFQMLCPSLQSHANEIYAIDTTAIAVAWNGFVKTVFKYKWINMNTCHNQSGEWSLAAVLHSALITLRSPAVDEPDSKQRNAHASDLEQTERLVSLLIKKLVKRGNVCEPPGKVWYGVCLWGSIKQKYLTVTTNGAEETFWQFQILKGSVAYLPAACTGEGPEGLKGNLLSKCKCTLRVIPKKVVLIIKVILDSNIFLSSQRKNKINTKYLI